MACEDRLDAIRRRLDTLETLPRAVFLLHRIDALDYAEIGYRLGIGVKEVEKHLARAMLVLTFGTDEERRRR